MSSTRKTAIVTGASQGIGAGIVKAFVERGFNVGGPASFAPSVVKSHRPRECLRPLVAAIFPSGETASPQISSARP